MANVLPPLTKFKRVALDLLFPQWCIGCGKEGDLICTVCRQSLTFIDPPVCPRCGRPISSSNSCSGCAGWEGDLDGIRSPFLFDGLIRHAIHEFKYQNLRALAPLLAGFLHDYLVKTPLPGDSLVAVPLHNKRYRERGYNQSALVARELGNLNGLQVIENSLIRDVYTSAQARTAGVTERQHNVTGAFTCRDNRVNGKKLILIDDVSTSGATLNACARALKSAGALTVWGLVLALEL